MPIYEYECVGCGEIFEVILDMGEPSPSCPDCGGRECTKLIGAPAVHVKTDHATARIEKRVKSQLMDGKVKDAVRFADKAASMVKSDRVKRIADKLHQKSGK
ncbi:MAG: zinc ribbon domain-containing protein [Desulfobacteria bacterium]